MDSQRTEGWLWEEGLHSNPFKLDSCHGGLLLKHYCLSVSQYQCESGEKILRHGFLINSRESRCTQIN